MLDNFILLLFVFVISHFIGSISFSVFYSKIRYKTDIRKLGSNNPGSTNIARVFLIFDGFIIFFLDIFKVLSSQLLTFFLFLTLRKGNSDNFLSFIFYFSGFIVVLSHCYPLFHNFKGGKGVACLFAWLLFFNFYFALVMFIVWWFVFLIFKKPSLASILSLFFIFFLFLFFYLNYSELKFIFIKNNYFLMFLIKKWFSPFSFSLKTEELVFILFSFLFVFIIFRHKKNLINLWKKKEKNFF